MSDFSSPMALLCNMSNLVLLLIKLSMKGHIIPSGIAMSHQRPDKPSQNPLHISAGHPVWVGACGAFLRENLHDVAGSKLLIKIQKLPNLAAIKLSPSPKNNGLQTSAQTCYWQICEFISTRRGFYWDINLTQLSTILMVLIAARHFDGFWSKQCIDLLKTLTVIVI